MTNTNIRFQTYRAACSLLTALFILFLVFPAAAQQHNAGTAAVKPADSSFFKTTKQQAVSKNYTYQYRRPTNELMHWPHYPETPGAAQQRIEQQAREQKPGNKLAKDVAASVLKKKKPVGTVPKF